MFSISNISNALFIKPSGSVDNILNSIETAESFSTDQLSDRMTSPKKPSDNKFLFNYVHSETYDYYDDLFQRLDTVLVELEESLPCVSIRDDCAIKAAPVLMQLPGRRRINTLK
ncbi:hypothetical protein SteCoe_4699 [Stentor coeruleus]|uniref:Uncharacterized protein n=1 Tax=Stentor coeruleus TaxID=5963 RepID=A0A1R2CU91_9CILI|nr:hypothetical protein SteCoe_4699 [Stentor coeruleus]